MNPIILLAVAAGAALLLLGSKRKVTPTVVNFVGQTQLQTIPIRVPDAIVSEPESDSGAEREDEDGRSWGTFYYNRDKRKHHELRVFRVAEDAGNSAIGNGQVVADVYETIVAQPNWYWHGQACGAIRFILTFKQGHLVETMVSVYSTQDKPAPSCQTVRPYNTVVIRTLAWVQRGPDVYLVLDTNSGINMTADDIRTMTPKLSSEPQWDNDYVASGDSTMDVSWIFNPTDAQGNPL